MFLHPISVIGYFVAGGGWLYLLFGAGTRVEILDRSLVNIHALQIADGAIVTGCAMAIAGVIAAGISTVSRAVDRQPGSASDTTVGEEAHGVRIMRDDERVPIDPAVLQKKLDQLKLR